MTSNVARQKSSYRHNSEEIKNFRQWDPSQLSLFLKSAGIGDYSEVFIRHKISGRLASLLTDDDLREMGINIVGDRLRIKAVLLDLQRKMRYDSRVKVQWEGQERRFFSDAEKCFLTCAGLFPDDPSTYRLTSNHLRIKQVNPARIGPIRLCCCYEYTINNIDLTIVSDVDVVGQPAPCLRRVICCAPGKDIVRINTMSQGNTVLVLVGGEGDPVSQLILHQVEEAQLMERA